MDAKADYTNTAGIRVEGTFENARNTLNSDLFKAIIREAYGAKDVIIAHHLVYARDDQFQGSTYETVEEIPSADTLIFDHFIAKKIWGDKWRDVLAKLAMEPCETRDQVLAELWKARK